jgi:hypothetical protein
MDQSEHNQQQKQDLNLYQVNKIFEMFNDGYMFFFCFFFCFCFFWVIPLNISINFFQSVYNFTIFLSSVQVGKKKENDHHINFIEKKFQGTSSCHKVVHVSASVETYKSGELPF